MPQKEPTQTTDKATKAPVRKRKSPARAAEVVKPLPTPEERQRIRDRAAASDV
jgi:hypothetical protein